MKKKAMVIEVSKQGVSSVQTWNKRPPVLSGQFVIL